MFDLKKANADEDPDHLDDGEDAEADAEAEDTADVREEGHPRRPVARLELEDGRVGEEELDGGDVALKRVVRHVQLRKRRRTSAYRPQVGLNVL